MPFCAFKGYVCLNVGYYFWKTFQKLFLGISVENRVFHRLIFHKTFYEFYYDLTTCKRKFTLIIIDNINMKKQDV